MDAWRAAGSTPAEIQEALDLWEPHSNGQLSSVSPKGPVAGAEDPAPRGSPTAPDGNQPMGDMRYFDRTIADRHVLADSAPERVIPRLCARQPA